MDTNKHELLFKEEVFCIIGAAIEVANELGCGFLESVYQEALEYELLNRNIPFIAQKEICICYKTIHLHKKFYADILVYNSIIVELKAIKRISEFEDAQILNYLKATNLTLGLVINFGSPKLEWKRYINTKNSISKKVSNNST